MLSEKRSKIGVDETVAIHDQHGIGMKRRARKAQSARGAERGRLDHRFDDDTRLRVVQQKGDDGIRAVPEAEDDPARAEAPQPREENNEKWAVSDRRKQLRNFTQH